MEMDVFPISFLEATLDLSTHGIAVGMTGEGRMPGALGICGGEHSFELGMLEELKKAKQDCPPFEGIFQG